MMNFLRSAATKTVKIHSPKQPLAQQFRTSVTSESGAILERPEQTRFGVVKALAVVIPFLWTGATVSKNGAAFLEENDIFVPDDDDD